MHSSIMRVLAAAAAGVALSAVGATGAGASGAALWPVRVSSAAMSHAAASPGTRLWVERYNGASNGIDEASSVAVSPTGGMVFVTGRSAGSNVVGDYDYATVAYNAATGAQLWVERYNGPGNSTDDATSMVVSPSGSTVFVTGYSAGTIGYDYATVAYNAATGAQLWVKRYTSLPDDYAHSVAVSPSGSTVFVTGSSAGTGGADAWDYATVAYNAATGAQVWVKRYNGATTGSRGANSVAVSPSGSTVYVTGSSYGGSASGYDYATVAYNAATGATVWVKRYNGPGSGDDQAYSVVVSPSGGTVFVTGYSYAGTTLSAAGFDYATVAYNAATGAQLWVTRYNGPGNSTDEAFSVAVSPSGSTVYVTGYSTTTTSGFPVDYATVAYNAVTGARLWLNHYSPAAGGTNEAFSMAVSPTSGTVFVTGESDGVGGWDYATIAYTG